MAKRPDNFLAEEVGRNRPRPTISLSDGFRLGFGGAIGVILVLGIIAGATWGIIIGFHLH